MWLACVPASSPARQVTEPRCSALKSRVKTEFVRRPWSKSALSLIQKHLYGINFFSPPTVSLCVHVWCTSTARYSQSNVKNVGGRTRTALRDFPVNTWNGEPRHTCTRLSHNNYLAEVDAKVKGNSVTARMRRFTWLVCLCQRADGCCSSSPSDRWSSGTWCEWGGGQGSAWFCIECHKGGGAIFCCLFFLPHKYSNHVHVWMCEGPTAYVQSKHQPFYY